MRENTGEADADHRGVDYNHNKVWKGPLKFQFPCDQQGHLQQSQTTSIVPPASKHAANAIFSINLSWGFPRVLWYQHPFCPSSRPLHNSTRSLSSRCNLQPASPRKSCWQAHPKKCCSCCRCSRGCPAPTGASSAWWNGDSPLPQHTPSHPSGPTSAVLTYPLKWKEKGAEVQTWDPTYADTASVLHSNSKFQCSLQSTISRRQMHIYFHKGFIHLIIYTSNIAQQSAIYFQKYFSLLLGTVFPWRLP